MAKHLYRITLILTFLFCTIITRAQFPYIESFRGTTAPGITFGGTPSAFLTAAGSGYSGGTPTGTPIDPNGQGYLRLTNNTRNQKGYIYSNTDFPSTQGLTVEFEYYVYGGNGADGISFFLFDASVPFTPGGFGGSLGYAQINTTDPVSAGVSKGYLAIGLDEFGNFSNPTEGRQGGIAGLRPGSVTLRGKGDGAAFTPDNYKFLTTARTSDPINGLPGFSLVGDALARQPLSSNPGYRRVFMDLIPNPAGGYNITVRISRGGVPVITSTVIDNFYYPEIPPAKLRYGLASSTGDQTNFHEIRNVLIDIYKKDQVTQAPVAVNDAYTTNVNTAIPLNILNNDIAIGGSSTFDKASIDIKSPPTHGTLVKDNTTGIVTYKPNDGYIGTDSFQYSVKDDHNAESNVATVTITVIPFAPDINVTDATSGTPKIIGIPKPNCGTIIIITQPKNGVVSVNPTTNEVTYTPNGTYSGPDDFTYVIKDCSGLTSTPGKVTVTSTIPAKIGLAKAITSNVRNQDGTYTLKYRFTIINYGQIATERLSLIDDLNLTFKGVKYTVSNITASGPLRVNPLFNGNIVQEMLTNFSTLPGNSKEYVDIEVIVALQDKEGTFTNTAFVKGYSVNDGSITQDQSTDGLFPDSDPTKPSDVSPAIPTPVTLTYQEIFIPGGFSPNGDGINDLFVIQNISGKQISLEVYNRWGNRIYRSTNYKNEWGGKTTEGVHIGDEVPTGTYYYIVMIDGKDKRVGHLTITR